MPLASELDDTLDAVGSTTSTAAMSALANAADKMTLSDKDLEEQTSACVRACFRGDVEALKAVLAATPDAARGADASFNDSTPLHVAVGETQPACARALLNAGADANARDVEKRTPLHQVDANCPRVLIDILVAGGGDEEGHGKHKHDGTMVPNADRDDLNPGYRTPTRPVIGSMRFSRTRKRRTP